MVTFRKASKKQVKLRGAFYGLSGGGKTYSALRVATGLAKQSGGRIGFIDTEAGDSELYADRFDFDVMVLEDKTMKGYVDAMRESAKAGHAVLVIDSLSHAWRELLEYVDGQKVSGDSFRAWAKATPLQKDFIDAIKTHPAHLIATMRADTAWEVGENDRGKKELKKLGLKPEQGKGIEYEFSFLVAIDDEHRAHVEKDRTGKFQDKNFERLTEDFGVELGEWLASGVKPVSDAQRADIKAEMKAKNVGSLKLASIIGALPTTYEEAEDALKKLREWSEPTRAAAGAAAIAALPKPADDDDPANVKHNGDEDAQFYSEALDPN